MAGNFAVPDWAQDTLIRAAGLVLAAPAITLDNDHLLSVIDLKTRISYVIGKSDGHVVTCE